MIPIVPLPRNITLRDSGQRLDLGGPDTPVPIAGPEWVKTLVHTIPREYPWLVTSYVGRAVPNPPGVVVNAPETVTIPPCELPDSSYEVVISSDGIQVTCAGHAGLVQALRTLGQLRDPHGLPLGTISDAPEYTWRGMHLDVCRHFFEIAFIKRLLRLLAAFGFNVFHWHLTEDQGWRIPITSYPRLTEVGAYRTSADGTRYGGYYTTEEITEIVAYAGSLGILVVPEIELPGHARAAIAAYPQLSCTGKDLPVPETWGIFDDVLCAGNDEVFSFLASVFDDVCGLFPSRYVHIGGDECPKVRWNECPKCRKKMHDEGLADADELQSYVIGRATRMLEQRGRLAIGWDEILDGGLPQGTLVMSWRGTSGGIKAASAGHQVIMTPTSHCYFDYRQTHDPDAIGFSFSDKDGNVPVTTVTDVYQYNPRSGLRADAAPNVLGGQANVWTETIDGDDMAEKMIAPRIIPMAEALWTAPAERDFSNFRPRARAALRVMDRMGWHYSDVPELR